jgi:hypothetical protein
VARLGLQLLGQAAHVALGAQDVVAGLVVARLGHRGHGQDGDVLHGRELARALVHLLLEKAVLVAQEIGHALELQLGLHARQHHRRADRLGDVVHPADLEAGRLRFDIGLGRQEQHRDVGGARVLLEAAADLVAVHLGHHHVEQDDVGRRIGLGDLQRALALAGHRPCRTP